MTNKEKARELANCFARQYHHNTYPELSHNNEFVFSNEEIEKACLEMAEWKEQQMVEKSCRVLESLLIGGVHPQGIQGFIKQFKQAMKGEYND